MKERPSWPMKDWEVRAILDGRKTQTRRVVKPQPGWHEVRSGADCFGWKLPGRSCYTVGMTPPPCPYGVPGDRLWVREGFATLDFGDVGRVYYRADSPRHPVGKWRSPLHMPRTVSRITLEIVGVRVERVQAISAKDILAEGAVLRAHDDQFGHNPVSSFDGRVYLDLLSLWYAGWRSIHGPASWDANPWVWVIEFRRVK